jgi:hypothetical protein
MPGRMTKDLDILLRHSDEVEVRERLEAGGYRAVSPSFWASSA